MNRKRCSAAFTLVELLVVIGIIAVLVSILLPALSKSRRQAMAVQCMSNMRQIAAGMLLYINDHKGAHPPAGSPEIAGLYGEGGWWYANELVRLKYMNTPGANVYPQPTNSTKNKNFSTDSPFRCP